MRDNEADKRMISDTTKKEIPYPKFPKLSVITPSFNQGKFLGATIDSVLSQGYPNLEYLVIDGGSVDGTVDILRACSDRLTYWVSEKDNGQSHAFNKGLQRATGDIIGWINSDDIYLDHCLFQAAEFFDSHPEVDIVFSDYWYIDEKGSFLKKRKEIPFHRSIYLWTQDCYHANCAGFFRRKVFETIGGLDETLHYGMDYEFYLRAATAGMKFGHSRDVWGAYRLHAQSKSISANEKQFQDAMLISGRYRPADTSSSGAWFRRLFYKAFRLLWKFASGSYLPIPARGHRYTA